MNLLDSLSTIKTSVITQLEAGANPEELRIAILGRKGELTAILRQLSQLAQEEKVIVGSKANQLRQELEALFTDAAVSSKPDASHHVDVTVPAYLVSHGSIHPLTAMITELVDIFASLSFEVVEGPELVTDWDNFGSLNFHKDHPARDNHDTFYIDQTHQLRTHTSAIQVKEMKRRFKAGEMPIRFIVPGKTYRRDSDATHSPMFHQLEGVMVDTQTTFSDMKGVLDYTAKRLFGNQVETRFRTHYFPFTEPSAEIDIRWKKSDGTAGKWIEWLGCGMIHPNVLEEAGINPKIYQGWAFGGGIERPVMIRNQVPDLRLFFENSVEFLNQFEETV